MLFLALVAAIVVEDNTVLRAAADDRAPRQADLAKGDWLELRGETDGFYQVWDHRHLRPGYVRPWRVRTYDVSESSAPDLRAVLMYLRDAPGSESLALSHAALYLKAAPPASVGAEIFDAIGIAADRLARRASGGEAAIDASIATHVEVARSLGVRLEPVVIDEKVRVCYDGEAFRTVLATSDDPVRRARAALRLTSDSCLAPETPALAVAQWNEWRDGVLSRADPAGLPDWLAGELHLRRAEVLAWLAYTKARSGELAAAAAAEEGAIAQLALVSKERLLRESRSLHDATAVKVGASRFAVGAATAVVPEHPKLAFSLSRAADGRASFKVATREAKGKEPVVGEIATSGIVWPGSIQVSPDARTVAVAVQLTPTWSEIQVLRRSESGWIADPVVPSIDGPESGYVEPAGFTADGTGLLICRESFLKGKHERLFEVLRPATLTVARSAASMDMIRDFKRSASVAWRGETLAVR